MRDHFPVLEEPPEEGMVVGSPGCLDCIEFRFHCTYGAGVQLDGSRRDQNESFCDSCKHDNLVCRFSRQQSRGESCNELALQIGQLSSEVQAHVTGTKAAGHRIALQDRRRLSRETKAYARR